MYLRFGMSNEDFWHGEPRLVRAYSDAWKAGMQATYHAEWRQGLYVAEAIATTMGKDHHYPDEPLFTTETEEEVAERRAREQMEKIKRTFLGNVARLSKEVPE